MKPNTYLSLAIIALAGTTLPACDWVDSTGAQEGGSGVVAEPSAPVIVSLDGIPIGDAIMVNDGDSAKFETAGALASGNQETYTFIGEPLDQGNLPECNFSTPEFVGNTLEEACTTDTDCQLNFQTSPNDDNPDELDTILKIPAVKASIGLRYTLGIEDAAGDSRREDRTFCITAINDPPTAVADSYTVFAGEARTFTLDDKHLLKNDKDDDDYSNEELFVTELYTDPADPTYTLKKPEYADDFVINSNGTFLYKATLSGIAIDAEDSFEYAVSDGVNPSVKGKVTVRIVVADRAPVQDEDIPLLTATQGIRFTADFDDYFSDPEDAGLTYALDEQLPLADGSGLSLDTDGKLEGVPTDDDVGSYQLNLLVSDGNTEIEAPVAIEVALAPLPVENRPPVFVRGTVSSRNVEIGTFVSVSPVFTDPDGDNLTYRMVGSRILPRGVLLDEDSGVISGIPRELGRFTGLQVQAMDTSGATGNSPPFRLTVQEAIE